MKKEGIKKIEIRKAGQWFINHSYYERGGMEYVEDYEEAWTTEQKLEMLRRGFNKLIANNPPSGEKGEI